VKLIWNFVSKHFLKKEFVLFIIIGGINTFNGTIFAFIYARFLHANLAFVFGYLTALIIAYFLNSYIVFKVKPNIIKLIKFGVSYIPNFIIQNIVVIIFYNLLQWHLLLVYALAAAIGIPVTFLILKVFAFNRQ